MMTQLKVGACVSSGFDGFKKNAGDSIGVVVIYGIITAIGGIIPFVNVAVNIAVLPVLSAGLSIFALNAARGERGKIEDLFKGFNKFGSFLGAYWLLALIIFAAIIPAAIAFGVDVAVFGGVDKHIPYITIVVSAVCLVVLVIAMIRFSMVNYLIIDGMTVMDAFRESARITRGFSGSLFLLALTNALIFLAGILLVFIGLLAAMPVCYIAYASAYTRLKEEVSKAETSDGNMNL